MKQSFDIPGRSFDFKKDLEFGLQSEKEIEGFLDDLSNGSFEVKTDRYRNGRMVIETDQNPRAIIDADGNRVWHKSGINVTTAKWWVYVFSPSQGFVVVDVSRVKRYLRANQETFNESTKINLGGNDNPARGFLLMKEHVQDLLTNEIYD